MKGRLDGLAIIMFIRSMSKFRRRISLMMILLLLVVQAAVAHHYTAHIHNETASHDHDSGEAEAECPACLSGRQTDMLHDVPGFLLVLPVTLAIILSLAVLAGRAIVPPASYTARAPPYVIS
jgi:hypothetical protein